MPPSPVVQWIMNVRERKNQIEKKRWFFTFQKESFIKKKELFMTTDDKIRDEKLQHNIEREKQQKHQRDH